MRNVQADEIVVGATLTNRGRLLTIYEQDDLTFEIEYQASPSSFVEEMELTAQEILDLLNK